MRSSGPIDIDWDPAWEEVIADVLHRLQELGDSIDGEVSEAERSTMIRRLEQE